MYYEINVSKYGVHFFATHERSLTSKAKMEEVYGELKRAFPESEGYVISVSLVRTTKEDIEFPNAVNPPSRISEYHIWSEGFVVTGQSSGAVYHGVSTGRTFREACIKYAQENPKFAHYFGEERLTYWGCKLFDNEGDARKTFG